MIPPLALAAGLGGLAIKNAEVRAAAFDLVARKAEADAAHVEATDRFKEFQRLDDLRTVDELIEREEDLWPAQPDRVPGMRRWLDDARAVLARLPQHRAALGALRKKGEAAVELVPGVDPAIDTILHVRCVRDAAAAQLAAGASPESRAAYLKRTVIEADARMPASSRLPRAIRGSGIASPRTSG